MPITQPLSRGDEVPRRVVDQHIKPAEALGHGVEQVHHLVGPEHVGSLKKELAQGA